MILEELDKVGQITVITTQPICIYTKTKYSFSDCFDHNVDSILEIDNIDESYHLDVVNYGNSIAVYIPRNVRCILTKSYNSSCSIRYKHIECDLVFEDEPIDNFFTINS